MRWFNKKIVLQLLCAAALALASDAAPEQPPAPVKVTPSLPPVSATPRNMVFMSPFGGYSPVNYNKKAEILDPDGKGTSIRPGDLSFPLIDLIRRAQKTIDIACYLYGIYTPEHTEIANACERGVKIRLFLDPSIKDKNNVPVINEAVERIRKDRLPIAVKIIDPARAEKVTGLPFQTMHEKFGIIDGRHVFTGSANIEPGANVKYTEDRFFFLDNPEMVKSFQGEFDRLWDGMGQWVLNPDEGKNKDERAEKKITR
jgi:phosphatidylserine/phosphatidylglycerophosphate/cardiolipin synthase-like enzyme